jgi:hypothetical protein
MLMMMPVVNNLSFDEMMMMPVLMIVVSVSWYYKNKKTGIIINIMNYSVLILLKCMQVDKKRS